MYLSRVMQKQVSDVCSCRAWNYEEKKAWLGQGPVAAKPSFGMTTIKILGPVFVCCTSFMIIEALTPLHLSINLPWGALFGMWIHLVYFMSVRLNMCFDQALNFGKVYRNWGGLSFFYTCLIFFGKCQWAVINIKCPPFFSRPVHFIAVTECAQCQCQVAFLYQVWHLVDYASEELSSIPYGLYVDQTLGNFPLVCGRGLPSYCGPTA